MNKKYNKIIIKSALTLEKIQSKNIINTTFNPDYVLNINLGLLNNFVNFNQFFNIATYDQNNNVQLEINIPFINNLLYNSPGFITFDSTGANIDVVNNPAYLKLKTNTTNLNYRFLEILGTKIFGDPTFTNKFLNSNEFINDYNISDSIIRQVIDRIGNVLSDTNVTSDILDSYSQLPVYITPTGKTNFNFRNTIWEFPIYLKGNIFNELGVDANTYNGPDMGGSKIVNGTYNIPILLRFFGISNIKTIATGYGNKSNNIVGYSYDASDWENGILPNLNKDYFSSVNTSLYSSNKWIIGGATYNDGSNNIMTSDDGITWDYDEQSNIVSNVLSLASSDVLQVARYIIGSDINNGILESSNTLLYSYNNNDWFISISGSDLFYNSLINVLWNGKLWVGIGINDLDKGVVGYSYDGINWIKSSSGSNFLYQTVSSIAWNGTIWLAGGSGLTPIIYSNDGINWLSSNCTIFTACNAITWTGTYFIVASSTILGNSLNGTTWTVRNSSLFSNVAYLASTQSISIASGTKNNKAQLAYSTNNGNTWIESPSISTLLSNKLVITTTVWNGTYWLGGLLSNNDSCTIIHSTDGINWTNTNTDIFSTNGFCNSLSWDGLQWTAVGGGYNGTNFTGVYVATSKDGYDWTNNSNSSSLIVYGNCTSYATILPNIIKGNENEMIIAAGTGEYDLMASLDTKFWIGFNLFYQTNTVVWIGNKWICGGPDGLGYSYDGIDWSPIYLPFNIGNVNVLYWNGFMVLAGLNEGHFSIIYSYDGLKWFPSYNINNILNPLYGIKSLTWGNNIWVAGTVNPPRKPISVTDPNFYPYIDDQQPSNVLDGEFTSIWYPESGHTSYQLVFTFDDNTKINNINCYCSICDTTDYLITGIQIEYLNTNSTYQTIFTNNNITISNFSIKESMYLFEAEFNLISTNAIRITFQKTTVNQIIISEIQFYEIIKNVLYSSDAINWTPVNSSKGIFRTNISSIIWDGYQFIISSYGSSDNNEKLLNFSNDLINWTPASNINNIFLETISLATDYEKYNSLINQDLNLCNNIKIIITDLSSQTFSWSGSGSQFLIQFIDSNNYLDFYDLTSSTKTINTSLNFADEYSYLGILSTINNNIISSTYFKFWSFNYSDLSGIVFNNGGIDYGFKFIFSYGITGDDNHSLVSLGIGINNNNDNSLIKLFPISNIDSLYLNNSQISINISYFDLSVYLTDNTNYLFSVVGVYKQKDFPTTYQINTISSTPFLFNVPQGLIPISNLRTTLISQTEIYISYSSPPDTSKLNNYIITLYPPDNNNNFTFETNNTTFNISSLNSNTSYDIRVKASYSFGDSLETLITISTLDFVGITNLVATPISTSIINISFTPPSELLDFINYSITLSPPDINGNNSFIFTNDSYNIENLESNILYNISIVVNYTTGSNLPININASTITLASVTNLVSNYKSFSSITVSFTPPNNLVNVINYTLSLSPPDSNNNSSFTFNSNSFILNNLIPDTIYNIGIIVNYLINEIIEQSPNTYIITNTLTTIPNMQYFTPSSIPNLNCWYDASDESTIIKNDDIIINWLDKSQNNNTLFVNSGIPIYNNNNINFQTGDKMNTNNIINVTTSSFLIAVININGLSNNLQTSIDFGGNNNNCIRFSNLNNSNNYVISQDINDFSFPNYNINGNLIIEIPLNTTFMVDGFSQKNNSGQLFLSGSGFNYYEILLYDSITSTQRIQLEGYLAWKWNIQNNLPINHPYKNISPNYKHQVKINNTIIPTNISGLQVWLDASDTSTLLDISGQINQWKDKSTNNNHFNIEENAPSSSTYNGLNVVIFNNTFFKSTLPATYPVDVYMVIKLNDTSVHRDVLGISNQSNDDFNGLVFSEYLESHWHNGSNSFIRTPDAVSNEIETSTDYLLIQWSIADNNFLIKRFSNTIMQTSSYSWNTLDSNFFYYLGNKTFLNNGSNFSGAIAEILIYNRQLEIDENKKIEGYLAWKWGLQLNLPSNHPFYYTPPLEYSLLTPNEIPNIKMWLDTVDITNIIQDLSNNILQINDKSGNGNNATQPNTANSPKYSVVNGLGIMSFNGTTSFLNTQDLYSNRSFSIFIIIQRKSPIDTIFLAGTNTNTNSNLILDIGNSVINFHFNNNDLGGTFPTPYSSLNESFNLLEFTFTPGNRQILVNGNLIVSDNNFSLLSNLNGMVFGKWLNTSQLINIGEVIVLNDIPDILSKIKLEGYLTWKWNIQKSLPISHQYYNNPPPLLNLQSDYTPDIEGNLTYWFDANDPNGDGSKYNDGTFLINWKNKIDNTIAINLRKPAIIKNFIQNNLSILRFNGQSNYLINYTNFPNTAYTIIAIVYNNSNNQNQKILSGQNDGYLYFGTKNGFVATFNGNGTWNDTNQSSINIYQKWSIISLVVSGTSLNSFVNGNNNETKNGSTGIFSNLGIGGDFTNNLGSFIGDIGEILIYSINLSNSQRQKVEGYLAWKWGINNNLSSIQDYKYLPPTVKPIFNVLDIPGTKIWFDSSDKTSMNISNNELLNWKNKSDNNLASGLGGFTGLDNQVTINNISTIHFPTNHFMTTSNIIFSSPYRNIFGVFNLYDSIDKTYSLLNSLITNGNQFIITNLNGTNILELKSNNTGVLMRINVSNKIYNSTNVFSTSIDNLNHSININSIPQSLVIDNTSTISFVPIRLTQIIGSPNANKIDIAELIVVDGILTQTQENEINAYLSWKWGLIDQLPLDNIYKTIPPSNITINFEPTSIPSLSLWLDSSDPNGNGSLVTDNSGINIWYDKSGYNRNAIAETFPNSSLGNIKNNIINGLSIMRFNGNQRYFITYPNFPNNAYTVFTIQFCSINTGNLQRLISGSDHDFSLFIGVKSNKIATFTSKANENWNDQNENIPNINNLNSWVLVATVVDGSVLKPYVNGTIQNLKEGTTQPFNNLYIGGTFTANQYWNGDIGDIMIFNEKLSDLDRQLIEGYLSWKWNLQNNLPNNHPYKNEQPKKPDSIQPIIDNLSIDPNLLPFVNLYINSKDTANMFKQDNEIISLKCKDIVLTSSLLPRPIYSNHSIYFYQNQCYMTLDNAVINNTSNYSMFFVLKINNFNQYIFYKENETRYRFYILINNLGNIIIHYSTASITYEATTNFNLSLNEMYLVSIIWNGINLVFRINGLLDSSTINGNFNIPDDINATFTSFGSFNNYESNYNLYNFIYCNTNISLDNINMLEGFLAWKWNLQNNLPFNHTYKLKSPQKSDVIPFKPSSLSNLCLWLDASDISSIELNNNIIIEWQDKSVIGNNGTSVNNPIYDSNNNCILFNGSSNYITVPYAFLSNETVFVVVNLNNSSNEQNIICGNLYSSRQFAILPNSLNINSFNNSVIATTSKPISGNKIMLEYTLNLSNISIYNNGLLEISTNGFVSANEENIIIGVSGFLNTGFLNGSISEIIIYNKILNNNERQKVEAYLAWKWGLVSSLPSNHLYKVIPINPLVTENFTPYNSGNVTTWLDGADISNMFIDISLNTLVSSNNQKLKLWRDKSPNKYYFTEPTFAPNVILNYLNNLTLVRFNNSYLKSYPLPFFKSANSGGTFFFVFNSNIQSVPSTLISYQNQIIGYSIDTIYSFGISKNDGNNTISFDIVNNDTFKINSLLLNNTGNSPSNVFITNNGNNVIVGNVGTGYFSAGNYPYQDNLGSLFIGSTNSNLFQNGDIAEIIWFNSILSKSEIQKIEGYLAWKWNIQSRLPNTHPFYFGSPTFQSKYIDFSPVAIPGLNLWLDCKDTSTIILNGSNVISWKDKSGLMNNASGVNNPIYDSSNNKIIFNGHNSYFTTPYTSYSQSESAFIVFTTNIPSNVQSLIDTNSKGGRAFTLFRSSPSIANSTNIWLLPTSTDVLQNRTYLAQYNYNNSEIKILLNGSLIGSAIVNNNFSAGITLIGAGYYPTSTSFHLNGTISEIIIYNSVLTNIQRQQIEGYLAWKWGIQSSLQNNHPYINYTPPPILLPLVDQNVFITVIPSILPIVLNQEILFTITIKGLYKYKSSFWTLNSIVVQSNINNYVKTFTNRGTYTITYNLTTENTSYIGSYIVNL
jgi:hypothetical protein